MIPQIPQLLAALASIAAMLPLPLPQPPAPKLPENQPPSKTPATPSTSQSQPSTAPAQPSTGQSQPTTGQPQSKLGKDEYRVSNLLPDPLSDNAVGVDLEVKRPYVVSGEASITAEAVKKAKSDQSRRIDRFEIPEGCVMFQLDVSLNTKMSVLGRSVQTATLIAPLILRTSDGQLVEPVGYWYEDGTKVLIRYTRDQPIRALQELIQKGATVTNNRPDQRLYLFFTPAKGTEATRLMIGNKVLHEFDPPVKMEEKRK